MASGNRLAGGAELRRRILGAGWVDRTGVDEHDPMKEFVAATIEHNWSAFWTRPGLDLRSRVVCTIAILAALGLNDELALQIGGALRNEILTQDEITELLLHSAAYVGYPLVAGAMRTAAEVFKSVSDEARSGRE